MAEPILEKICSTGYDELPPIYKIQDLKRFSIDWKLYEYQIDALKKALVFLHRYKEKKSLYNDYREHLLNDVNLWENLSIKEKDENYDFLSEYYPVENNEISFKDFINRAAFWMATGSGKTLVMIKLIELLFNLAKAGEIPERNIMILAPKDDILNQIKTHVHKFNTNGTLKIELRDLREFEHINSMQQSLYDNNTITVFYYRADNIRSENKEKLLDYKTVLNNSQWYVILDEAHKGNSDTSSQQQYFSLLSKNGLLFNFSATFTDDIDITTTLYNFNLKRFLENGYGKHIKVVDEDFGSFRNRANDEQFTDEEKRYIVLKSLITFAAVKKHAGILKSYDNSLYHNPLLITTANQVNTDKADLKIFFQQLAEIGAGNFDLREAKIDLVEALLINPTYQFATNKISDGFIKTIQELKQQDIYKYVFNSEAPGKIEYTQISGNNREIAFRLKSATEDGHFGLIVASEVNKWEENVLSGYERSNSVLTESFFDDLNDPENKINLLLGSRIFTEGWDSNRPNVINFINIGVNEDAKKFVLQTTGRGVRIEPIKNQRNRLKYIKNKEAISKVLSNKEQKEIVSKNLQLPLESLFIFATDKDVITNVIEGLNRTSSGDTWTNVSGIEKTDIKEDLLIPVYKTKDDFIPPSYQISDSNFNDLLNFIGEKASSQDKKLLMSVPDEVCKNIISTVNKVRQEDNIKKFPRGSENDPFQELLAIHSHFHNKPERIDHYKPVTIEIKHFDKVQAKNIDNATLEELEKKLVDVLDQRYSSKDELFEAFQNDEITKEQFEIEFKVLSNPDFKGPHSVNINKEFIREHYYRPILYAQRGFEDVYRHIIKIDSEIEFLSKLEEASKEGVFEQYEWWYFSKLEENVDEIFIPYYDSEKQEYRKFYPDFIFWLKKGNQLFIKFIDPKGPRHQTNVINKIQGYEKSIVENDPIYVGDNIVNPSLWFWNSDIRTHIEDKYLEYWSNDLGEIFRT